MSAGLAIAVLILVAAAGTVLGRYVRRLRADRKRFQQRLVLVTAGGDSVMGRQREQIAELLKENAGLRADLKRCHTEVVDLRAAAVVASAECADLTDRLDTAVREATSAALVLMETLSGERAEHRRRVLALESPTPMFDALFVEDEPAAVAG